MADCTGKITADILKDCDYLPVGGLELDVVLINEDDINRDAVTFDNANRLKMTNLQLKSGKTGYKISGVKQSNGKRYELVKKENAPDKFKQFFSGVVFAPSAANKLQLANLTVGARYIVVVEQKWKGASNAEAFEVLGYNSGLELATLTNNSRESDNAILFELASPDGYEEPNPPYTLLETSYAATKTLFTNKFIEA